MHLLRTFIPMLVMPTTVGLLLVLAGLLMQKRRWLIWSGLAVLWVASTPVVSDGLMRAVEGFRVRHAISAVPSADAIVVLSLGVQTVPGDLGVVEFGELNRFLGGFDLYRAGKSPKLIFTGCWSVWSPNTPLVGDVLVARAREFGIPESALFTTGKVSNTEQEAAAVAALLRAAPEAAAGAAFLHAAPTSTPGNSATAALESFGNSKAERAGAPRILLVTSAYHMRRAEKLFRAAGLDVIPFPVDFQTSPEDSITIRSFIPSAGALQQTELALHEVIGSIYYWIKG